MTPRAGNQAAIPVAVSTEAPAGAIAVPVIGYTAETLPDGLPVAGDLAALPVYLVSDAELASGAYVLQGNVSAVPLVAVADRPAIGSVAPIAVYVVGGSLDPTPPTPPFDPLDLSPRIWLTGATLPESGAIATWEDSSGNNNDGTQGTAGARPTVSTIGGQRAASFDGGDWLACPSVMPTGATSAGRYTKAVVARLAAITSTLNNLISGATQHAMRVLDNGSGNGRLRSLNGSGGNAINAQGPNLAINTTYWLVVSWAPDLGLHTLYVNGAWADNNVATGTAGGTTQSDTAVQIGGFASAGNLNGLLGEVFVFPALLAGQDQHDLTTWAYDRYGIAGSSLPVVVGIGGSWMQGYPVTGGGTTNGGDGTTGGQTLLGQTFALLGLTVNTDITAYNDGFFGQPLSTLLTTQTVYSRYTMLAPKRVCLFWITSNDLANGDSAATVLTRAETEARRLVATGYTVLILPVLPRTSANPNYETSRATVNAGLASGAAGWDCTYVDIFAGDAAVLNNPAVISNTTYYQADQIHLTAASYALIAANVAPALAAALA